MITFYANNLVDQSTIVPSSVNNLYPINNVKDPRRTKTWRSLNNADSFVLDFGESSEFDSILMVPNQVSGWGISTVLIEANATNTWGAPAFSTTLSLNVKHGISWKELDAVQNYRFVKFTFTSSLSYCEVANFFVGMKTQTSRGINYNWTNKSEDLSVVKENRIGQKFTDIIGRQKLFNGQMANLNDADIEKFRSITDLKGKIKPFFVKIGCTEAMSDPYRFIAMVFFSSIPNESNRFYSNWGVPVQLEEAR